MNERQFLKLVFLIKPRAIKRQTAFRIGSDLHEFLRFVTMAIFHPRIWWTCRRVELHLYFGLPAPKLPPYSIEA